MSVHVGIEPYFGKISYYDNGENETVDINIKTVKQNEIEKVSLMFEEIKSKFNGKQLGCVCICLEWNYGNEIRKHFLQEGLKCGFKSVEIINEKIAAFVEIMSQINYQPSNGNFIWIYCYRAFYVWQIINQKAKYIGIWLDLKKYQKESKTNKGPDIVIYNDEIDKELLAKLFNCEFYKYNFNTSFFRFSGASLLKARITAGDPGFAHFDVLNILVDGIILKYSNEEIASFKTGHELPINYSKLIKDVKDDVLQIVI